MDFIQFGKKRINFEIKRGNREKSVGIHVHPAAKVTVLAPRHLDEEKIRMILQKKARWIIEKQQLIRNHGDSNPVKEFVSGESFPYLGKNYRLKVVRSSAGREGKCKLVNGRLLVETNGKSGSESGKTVVRKAIIEWYFEHAENKVKERLDRFALQIGKRPASVEIKNQVRRWGSCSRNGMVRLNWKIIMAPVSVIDYVIVHELCHLVYPQHSSQFWQKIQSIIPDYKRRREWLKGNGLIIRF
jgi:predicted metal-dependent hydrolase